MGSFECSAEACDYLSFEIVFGQGMLGERELRTCAACGGYTTVLTARFGEHGREPASGRGRCPECGSQRLRRPAGADDRSADALPAELPCPRCAAPLLWQSFGMWD